MSERFKQRIVQMRAHLQSGSVDMLMTPMVRPWKLSVQLSTMALSLGTFLTV